MSRKETTKGKPKSYLKLIDVDEVQKTFELQKKSGEWDFLKERELWEYKFGTSFNNFVIVYSIFLNAIIQIKPLSGKIAVISLGILLTTMMLSVIHRTYVKLEIILKIVYTLPNQSLSFIAKEQKAYRSFAVTKLMGLYVPYLCIFSLIIGLIYYGYNYFDSIHKTENKTTTEKTFTLRHSTH